MEAKEDEVVAFGMTERQISELADACAEVRDSDHPMKSGTWADFVKTARAGREKLSKGSYCKVH